MLSSEYSINNISPIHRILSYISFDIVFLFYCTVLYHISFIQYLTYDWYKKCSTKAKSEELFFFKDRIKAIPVLSKISYSTASYTVQWATVVLYTSGYWTVFITSHRPCRLLYAAFSDSSRKSLLDFLKMVLLFSSRIFRILVKFSAEVCSLETALSWS